MKISGALPKGDANGLSPIETKVIRSRKSVAAVVILEPTAIDEDISSGDKSVRMGIRRIEALLPEDVETATRLLLRAFEKRTGQTTLPIELEDDLNEALKGVQFDTETGEVFDDGSEQR